MFGLIQATAQMIEYQRLTREGEATVATIMQLDKDDSGDSTTCHVTYTFKGPDPKGLLSSFHDRHLVSCSLYDDLRVGHNIEILYAASDPSLSAIKEESGSKGLGGIGIPAIFTLFGLFLIYTELKRLQALRQLREEGQQTEAVLFDRWQENSDNGTIYLVAYAFKIPTPEGPQIIIRAEQNKKIYKNYRVGNS